MFAAFHEATPPVTVTLPEIRGAGPGASSTWPPDMVTFWSIVPPSSSVPWTTATGLLVSRPVTTRVGFSPGGGGSGWLLFTVVVPL